MTNMIWITTEIEGFHKYPKAPERVSYLKNLHRHMFKVKVWIEVFHNDRDVEFILFKGWINLLLKHIMEDIKDSMFSCEMLSDLLFKDISINYPSRDVFIEISEDGENGSYKQYYRED